MVLGMHRSGTGLIARMLDRLGIFMGAELDPNHEAFAFLELNQFALDQCGGRWDHPERVFDLLEHPQLRRVVREYFAYMVDSPFMRRYTGSRFGGGLDGMGSGTEWGWKDPRTILLLPIWLDIFPDARLVHVRRHGVDVAASLRRRHRDVLAHTTSLLDRGSLFSWKEPDRPVIDTVRAGTLEGAFDLWELYLDAATRHLEDRQVLELRYEELVTHPEDAVGRLVHHLALEPSTDARSRAVDLADPGRALAYREDGELTAFAHRVADRLSHHGYRSDETLTPEGRDD